MTDNQTPASNANAMEIREIAESDFKPVIDLLCEGFPKRDEAYWQRALERLRDRPVVAGYPQYGYLLRVGGQPGGVLLLLTSLTEGRIMSNLSSWYVREEYRKFSVFMFQRAIRKKGGCYLNISPSKVALPIATALGFSPYTAGSLLVLPSVVLLAARAQVDEIDVSLLSSLPEAVRNALQAGCKGLWVQDSQGGFCTLYRPENIKKIPAARFVYGDPERLLRAAPSIARFLLKRGLPLILLDVPRPIASTLWHRFIPNRGRRFFKGEPPPQAGNLLETELVLFGA